MAFPSTTGQVPGAPYSSPRSIYPGAMATGGGVFPQSGGTGGMSSVAQPGQMLPQPRGVLPMGSAPSLAAPSVLSPTTGNQTIGTTQGPAVGGPGGGGSPTYPPGGNALQVASNGQIAANAAQQQQVQQSQVITPAEMTGLAAYIARQWEMMNRHRLSLGISDRLLAALRAFNGQYDPSKLAEIRRFGGSDVYARIISSKCRGATSLLRDIYINQERPWSFTPPPDVDVPIATYNDIVAAVQGEVANLVDAGQQPELDQVRSRTKQLIEAARQAAKKKAAQRAKIAEDKVETLLDNGDFYNAVAETLADLTIYPYCILKGPTVRMLPTVEWQGGAPAVNVKPVLWYERCSPFDVWFSPGVPKIQDGQVIERKRYTRAALNDLLDLPGYDHDAVRAVLRDYANGLTDIYDYTESARAILESRENPQWNETGLIDCMEFHGNVQGRMLIEAGIAPNRIGDPMRDYMTTAWKIGRYIIKIQLNPSPRKRHPYFSSSFEKVPGTPIGNGLPDILADVQDMGNVALRSMANNMAFSSGPQVMIDDSRLAPSEDGESFYPWKRWHARTDPFTNNIQSLPPISFFQPQDNTQAYMAAYNFFLQLGDDQSAVPRYITSGTGTSGGASRTASGLAMLMGNASKVLQTVAGNYDIDIVEPVLTETKDIILLTDTSNILEGNETIVARGAQVAQQRETLRSRQLEFLQVTNNPVDNQIMGLPGRAEVLKAVSNTLGMPGDDIVPDPDELRQVQEQQEEAQIHEQAAFAAAGGGMGGGVPGATPGGSPSVLRGANVPTNGPPGKPPMGAPMGARGNQPPNPTAASGPRTNLMQPRLGGPSPVAGGVG